MKKYPIIFSALLLVMLFTSCSMQYLPVKTTQVDISENYAIFKNDKYIIVVDNRYWGKEPQNISDYFTGFYITIKNKTDEKVSIKPQDIILLDDTGTQFDPVLPENVETILVPDELRYNDLFSQNQENTQILENWREARQNLMKYSFHFGEIFPNAKKSGFIFFDRLPTSNKKCFIICKDQKIEFTKMKKK